MAATSIPAWHDPALGSSNDTQWARGLRLLQSWWRAEVLGLPPGPNLAAGNDRPIGSNLPMDVDWEVAFIGEAAARRARRLAEEHVGPGIVDAERLRRSLLTSQGVAVNAFAPLERHPDVLLRWASIAVGADLAGAELQNVRYEWAPDPHEHFSSGSAFDVMLDIVMDGGAAAFVAVEVKYAEHLADQAPPLRSDKYQAYTRSSASWRDGAEVVLVEKPTRQLWINALLADSLVTRGSQYSQGWSVVLTCGADDAARGAATDVAAAQAADAAAPLSWSGFEDLVAAAQSVPDLAGWRDAFVARYLDLRPVAGHLPSSDARRAGPTWPSELEAPLRQAHVDALAIAERVLGDGSVLQQLIDSGDNLENRSRTQVDLAVRELSAAVEALKGARRRLAPR